MRAKLVVASRCVSTVAGGQQRVDGSLEYRARLLPHSGSAATVIKLTPTQAMMPTTTAPAATQFGTAPPESTGTRLVR